MSKFPDVDFYKDWKAWAKALVQVLTKPAVPMPILLPQYTTDQMPTPNRDGMLLWNLTVPCTAYSAGGHWYNQATDALIV